MEYRARWCNPQRCASHDGLPIDDQRVVRFRLRRPDQADGGPGQRVLTGAAPDAVHDQVAAVQHRGYRRRMRRALGAGRQQVRNAVSCDGVCKARFHTYRLFVLLCVSLYRDPWPHDIPLSSTLWTQQTPRMLSVCRARSPCLPRRVQPNE